MNELVELKVFLRRLSRIALCVNRAKGSRFIVVYEEWKKVLLFHFRGNSLRLIPDLKK